MPDQVEEKEEKGLIEVVIGFDATKEEIKYIKSDFMSEKYSYKDPIGYTAKLLQMGLEHWIRDKIGLFCPECDSEMDDGWKFCPECGWSSEDEETE